MDAGSRNGDDGSSRGPLEQGLLAALGWVALTAEGIEDIADDLACRVGLDREAMRGAVRDVVAAWRHEGERLDARRTDIADGVVGRLGVAQKAEFDDLALRVAQFEHRLKLLERD